MMMMCRTNNYDNSDVDVCHNYEVNDDNDGDDDDDDDADYDDDNCDDVC